LPAEPRLGDRLAASVVAARLSEDHSALADNLRLHVFDTLGALFAGVQTSEGKATCRTLDRLFAANDGSQAGNSPASIAAIMSACARLTEADDIHIQSCATPGSVVVAAALAATTLTPNCSRATFCAAIIAGYDVMIALGLAIDGARVVYDKTWPTYFGGAMTAAATAGKVLELDVEKLRHALAIAATTTTGAAGKIPGDPSSRWLTLACAVQNGVAAALAAECGILGDLDVLEMYRDQYGLTPTPGEIASGEALAATEIKPFCTGRQSLSATEAFATLIRRRAISPASIRRVEVRAPAQFRSMIDRSARPKSKLESRGVRYQLALAAFHPDDLLDIERGTLRTSEQAMSDLMDRIEVVTDERLTQMYPRLWGAIVGIETTAGHFECEVLEPKGSPANAMTTDDVAAKLRLMSRFLPRPIPVEALADAARDVDHKTILTLFRDWRAN
jgi:2-methylcitrate dehydratase PrpD